MDIHRGHACFNETDRQRPRLLFLGQTYIDRGHAFITRTYTEVTPPSMRQTDIDKGHASFTMTNRRGHASFTWTDRYRQRPCLLQRCLEGTKAIKQPELYSIIDSCSLSAECSSSGTSINNDILQTPHTDRDILGFNFPLDRGHVSIHMVQHGLHSSAVQVHVHGLFSYSL